MDFIGVSYSQISRSRRPTVEPDRPVGTHSCRIRGGSSKECTCARKVWPTRQWLRQPEYIAQRERRAAFKLTATHPSPLPRLGAIPATGDAL